jgi:hypothetical protein
MDVNWDVGHFSVTAQLQNKKDKIIWSCTMVYGPTDAQLKPEFSAELTTIGNGWSGPWIVGGVNATRSGKEK